jgi:hypothetical protein
MREALERQTRLLLGLLGCPARMSGQWTTAGMRRFLSRWSNGQAGSLRELELVLGLADPDVRLFGTEGSDGRLRIDITWSRWKTVADLTELSHAAAAFTAWVSAVITWWEPLGVSANWSAVWPGAAVIVAPDLEREADMPQEARLLEQFAADFLRVRRGRPVPPRCWVSLSGGGSAVRARHEIVLGDTTLDRCIFNVGRWSPAVRVEDEQVTPGRTELKLTALREITRLELLARPGLDRADFRVNDHPSAPAALHRWPERYDLPLASPVRRGTAIRVVCNAPTEEPVALWTNPVLFETCRYTKSRAYERDFRDGGDPPGTYRNVVRPGGETIIPCQPFPLTDGLPEESDCALFNRAARAMLGRHIARRSDLARMVAALFPAAEGATCAPGGWEETDPSGWKRHVEGEILRVVCAARDDASIRRLQAGVERFVRRYATVGRRILVQMASGGVE